MNIIENGGIHPSKYKGKINLIFTSPPFSLVKKKKYGNKNGEDYINWLKEFSQPLTDLLTDDGSIVIELGNAWEKGSPTFSTVPMESLLEFKKESNSLTDKKVICFKLIILKYEIYLFFNKNNK